MRRLLRIPLLYFSRNTFLHVADDHGGGGACDAIQDSGENEGTSGNRDLDQLLLDGSLWSEDDDLQLSRRHFRYRALCFCLCAARPFYHLQQSFSSTTQSLSCSGVPASFTSLLQPILVAVLSDVCACIAAASAVVSQLGVCARELLVRQNMLSSRSAILNINSSLPHGVPSGHGDCTVLQPRLATPPQFSTAFQVCHT
jgi:hypothetical protein